MEQSCLDLLARATALHRAAAFDEATDALNGYLSRRTFDTLPSHDNRAPGDTIFSLIVTMAAGHSFDALIAEINAQGVTEFEIVVAVTADDPLPQSDKTAVIVCPPEFSVAEQRNAAASMAHGAVLVFLDTACSVEPEYLEQLARIFSALDIYAVRGRIPPRGECKYNFLADHLDFGPAGCASTLEVCVNLAVLREAFVQAGGFHPLLSEGAGTGLACRLANGGAGDRMSYRPNMVARRDWAASESEWAEREALLQLDSAYLQSAYPTWPEVQARRLMIETDRVSAVWSGLDLPQRSDAPRLGRKELELGLMLRDKGKLPVVIEHFKGTRQEVFSSLVSSSMLRLGQYDAARQYLATLPQTEEVRLKQKTAELLPALNAPLKNEPRVHILLLACNREEHVGKALQELAQTNYSNYAVYVADNGSSDATHDKAETALAAFPEHIQTHLQRFPVNIGRPIGHNWLLSDHDHSAAEYICIADDDLFAVEPDWLTRMVKTMQLFPDAAVVGGKAYGPEQPKTIHGGVRNIQWLDREDLTLTGGQDELDYGQLDFIDTVDHVIGCLHIYRHNVLFDGIGMFDPGLSPCQRVDVDHHLRVRLNGGQIIYNGFIEIGHLREGGGKPMTSALLGNVLGNQIKMLYKHDPVHVRAVLKAHRKARETWLDSAS